MIVSGGAQLVRGVGDELALRLERRLQAVEHRVELVGEVLELVGRAVEADSLVEAVVADAARGGGDLVHGPQQPPRDEPAEAKRDDRHQPQRDARLPQDLAQGVVLDVGNDVVEERCRVYPAQVAGRAAAALHEEDELAAQLARIEIEPLLEALPQAIVVRGKVAGDEREVEGQQHRAREQEQRPVPEREAQPDRRPRSRGVPRPEHHGMR